MTTTMPELDFDQAAQTLHDHTENPQAAKDAVAFLGEAGSKSEDDRRRLAGPDIFQDLLTLLDSCITVRDQAPPVHVAESTVRCLANAVVPSNEARQMATDHGFASAGRCFRVGWASDVLRHRTLIFLYNVCFEYEPAQKRCCEQHVHEDVLDYFCRKYAKGTPHTEVDDGLQFGDLLLSICDKRQRGSGWRDLQSLSKLLFCTLILRDLRYEAEDLAMTVEVALIFLRDEAEQARIAQFRYVHRVWEMLELVEEKNDEDAANEIADSAKLLVPLSASLTWCLSDIAATPDCAKYYGRSPNYPFTDRMLEVISGSGSDGTPGTRNPRLISAACQILGNILWGIKDIDPSTHRVDLMDPKVHQGLMSTAVSVQEAETLHSIAGLLIQMCRHSLEYKARLSSDEKLEQTLSMLCRHESKEVRQGGLKLLQLLCKDDPAIREKYASLAKEVIETMAAEQTANQQLPSSQNANVVEVPE